MKRTDRGAVLLLVLGAVAILAIVAVELAGRASTETLRGTRASREAAFRRLFDSGIEIARSLLAASESETSDHWGEAWNSRVDFALGPGESATVHLADESGKINIARAISHPGEAASIRRKLGRLFEYLRKNEDAEPEASREIESRVLERLKSRAPLLTLDGLREVNLTPGQIFEEKRLSRLVTCFGTGQTNLNTAPKAVLYALYDGFDETLADRIAGYRGRGEGEPGAYKPFKDTKELESVPGIVVRGEVEGETRVLFNHYERVGAIFSTKSDCFSVRIEAVVDGHRREAWAFFRPDGVRLAYEEIRP